MKDAKPVSMPADVNVNLKVKDSVSEPVDQNQYHSMVGSMLYAATRLDIARAVAMVSEYNSNPNEPK